MAEIRETVSTGAQKGVKEARYDLIPVEPLRLLAVHYGRGAKKYAPHNFRAGIPWSMIYAALQRHANTWQGGGQDYDVCSNDPDGCLFEYEGRSWVGDPDTCFNHTGSHHLVAVVWMAMALLEFKDTHPELDDRYIVGGENGEITTLVADGRSVSIRAVEGSNGSS